MTTTRGAELDLRPRSVDPAPARRRKRPWAYVAVIAVLVALGFVVFNGLQDATVFFLNVDDAVERRDEMGAKRLRIQGNVVGETLVESSVGATFDLTYNSAVATVRHLGDRPALFQPGIPVVIEGAWNGTTFESDRILVKHDSEYGTQNPARIDDAETDAERRLSFVPVDESSKP